MIEIIDLDFSTKIRVGAVDIESFAGAERNNLEIVVGVFDNTPFLGARFVPSVDLNDRTTTCGVGGDVENFTGIRVTDDIVIFFGMVFE